MRQWMFIPSLVTPIGQSVRCLMAKDYYAEIHDSVKAVDSEEWNSLIHSEWDVAMSQPFVHLIEATLSDQARFWTIAIRDRQRRLAAAACLSLFETDVMQAAPQFLQSAVEWVRSFWPQFLKSKVLFCGLPLPPGELHLRIRESTDPQPVLQLLTQVMLTIARQEKAALLVFKEPDTEEMKVLAGLQTLGFINGEMEPLYQLPCAFKNFQEYQSALRSSYRHQVQANVKKFKASGLKAEHIVDPQEIHARFTAEVHQLYLNVWKKAKEKLECLPLSFFRDLPQVLPGLVSFTLISDGDKPVAFSLGIVEGEIYHNMYVGLDYSYTEKADLYFNLFYHELDAAFGYRKKQIWLGQTSGVFKSRLGAVADPRFFWVRSLNPFFQLIFKWFHPLIFPKLPPTKPNQVFKSTGASQFKT